MRVIQNSWQGSQTETFYSLFTVDQHVLETRPAFFHFVFSSKINHITFSETAYVCILQTIHLSVPVCLCLENLTRCYWLIVYSKSEWMCLVLSRMYENTYWNIPHRILSSFLLSLLKKRMERRFLGHVSFYFQGKDIGYFARVKDEHIHCLYTLINP